MQLWEPFCLVSQHQGRRLSRSYEFYFILCEFQSYVRWLVSANLRPCDTRYFCSWDRLKSSRNAELQRLAVNFNIESLFETLQGHQSSVVLSQKLGEGHSDVRGRFLAFLAWQYHKILSCKEQLVGPECASSLSILQNIPHVEALHIFSEV